ncbi:affinity nitrate transporter 2 [Seminavis robusta]|uniref:Nitrate/nitrite transporter n=1 Tax=Seminavis robusta TaxID=568900 RepID=A0A9N8DEQ3_9STRA|nr:affinity nitrate transporter 2 [Seminavis robusta]|eukprot:Sro121_g058960.1 affinity nitrate transporter 2 (492) ;mRNA; f:76475-78046
MSSVPTGEGEGWKKYSEYHLEVDPDQDDKATEIKLCSFARPHMRAFHLSWLGFFIAFFIWFAIAPLLSEIKDTLGLTKQEVWTSSIVGVGGTILMRFVNGPLCDKFGARIPFTLILCFASIPCALTGIVNSAATLAVLRLFIGFGGSTFVMCQYWASRMFAREVVGTANALCGGWGNLGGGVTQLVMGSLLFPLFKEIFKNSEDPAEKAWRTVCIVPAVVGFAFGVSIYFLGDDAPKGNYKDLKMHGAMPEVSAAASFRSGTLNFNTWLLFIQYACCFGVELTMNNAAALYFKEVFGQSTESAAAIASIFGWMNLFARGLGGWASDKANARMGMRGRIIVHTFFLLAEGILVLVFANTKSLGLAIVVMVFFSLNVQAAEGTSYGIVPYVDPPSTGSIAGIVGAGGNTGAVLFGLGFRNLEYYDAFILMGIVIIISAGLSGAIYIKGHSALFCGKDEAPSASEKGAAGAGDGVLIVPEPDKNFEEIEEEIDC